MFDRFTAEAMMQALTGGVLPEDTAIPFFDKTVGWRFIPIGELLESLEIGTGPIDLEDLPLHHETHEDGGEDEINVEGLSGLLADAQTPLAHTHTASEITDFEDAWEVEFEEDIDRIACDETYDVVVDENFNVTLSEA